MADFSKSRWIVWVAPLLALFLCVFVFVFIARLPMTKDASYAQLARELALRNPILGLDGVDPKKLRDAAGELENALRSLAALQESATDSRRVLSLYPTHFLRALADAEEARQRFLRSSSEGAYRVYDAALQRAIEAGLSDAKDFNAALTYYVAGSAPFRLAGLGGTITDETILISAASTLTRLNEVDDRYRNRAACLSGDEDSCNTQRLSVSPPVPPYPDTSTPHPLTRAVEELRAEARGKSNPADDSIVVLSESWCTALAEAPHSFLVTLPDWQLIQDERGYRPPPPIWRDDIVFYKIGSRAAGTTGEAVAERYGIEYLPINPTQYYTCPDVLNLIGAAHTITAIAAFAESHPAIDVPSRTALVQASAGGFREEDALAYLHDAWQQYPEARDELAPLLNRWREKSDGLADLVIGIARGNLNDIKLKKSVPFDLSAKNLFLTRSAFPSLFLLGNDTAGSSSVPLREKNDRALSEYFSGVELYSSLRFRESRDVLVESLRGFYTFEHSAEK